jgi:hypothetical protein
MVEAVCAFFVCVGLGFRVKGIWFRHCVSVSCLCRITMHLFRV